MGNIPGVAELAISEKETLNERIIGKSKLVFLIEDEDGEIFGYYLNTKIIDKYTDNEGWIHKDANCNAAHTLESRTSNLLFTSFALLPSSYVAVAAAKASTAIKRYGKSTSKWKHTSAVTIIISAAPEIILVSIYIPPKRRLRLL